ncbi:pir-1 [Scenedesmus sp. PABB004]|nr:pir-1 [Scenedesmus sp. PABB004]
MSSVDIDPGWYEGQPETFEPDAAPAGEPRAGAAVDASHVPTVLTKLRKWGDYAAFGEPVAPSRFIPMKTPLSTDILGSWQLPEPPAHSLTVRDLLAAQAAAGRRVGLVLDLSNHDCLYTDDIPHDVRYIHVQLVAKELPPREFVAEVAAAARAFWAESPGEFIAVHCAYGFNRTGFVVCSYLIEHCGLSVDEALASFAASRPPGVKHERFRDELRARYGGGGGLGLPPLPPHAAHAAAGQQPPADACGRQQPPPQGRCARCSSPRCGGGGGGCQPAADGGQQQPAAGACDGGAAGGGSKGLPPPGPPARGPSDAAARAAMEGSPLPRLPARCYSSGSVGDNSSIGCSPDRDGGLELMRGGRAGSPHAAPAARPQAEQAQAREPPRGEAPESGCGADEEEDCFTLELGSSAGGGGGCDGRACCEQRLGDAAELSRLVQAVQQQRQLGGPAAAAAPSPSLAACPCACHNGATGRASSDDGAQAPRLSSDSGLGLGPGRDALENESFGNSVELLDSLRRLRHASPADGGA